MPDDVRALHQSAPLIDPFARAITYLRVSVTDRCDFRCVYCMAEDMTFLPKSEVLSIEELERLCRAFVRLGVRKLRLTGGEPLVRRGVMTLIERLGKLLDQGALDELTLTTNGSQLAKHSDALVRAGVRRVNVSLDTLDPEKFTAITRWGRLEKVLEGLAAAKAAGLAVKINTVALKGVNEDELHRLVEWAGGEGFDLTFIEVMPLGEIGADVGTANRVDQFFPLSMVRARLKERRTLDESDHATGGPARYWTVRETGRRLGFGIGNPVRAVPRKRGNGISIGVGFTWKGSGATFGELRCVSGRGGFHHPFVRHPGPLSRADQQGQQQEQSHKDRSAHQPLKHR